MTTAEERLAGVVRYVRGRVEQERRTGRPETEHLARTIALVVEAIASGDLDGGGVVVPVEPVLERLCARGMRP